MESDEGSDNLKGSGDDEDSGDSDDKGSGDSDDKDSGDGSDSEIELIDGEIKLTSATQKGKVAASHGAQRKQKLPMQVIDEESSDDESGESVYCIRFLLC